MAGIARIRGLTAAGLLCACACALVALSGAASAGASTTLRTVHYRALSVHVPRSWPVFDLTRDPRTCVRFNRHALYLGTPGAEERCPAHAVGRTDAILLSPLRGGQSVTASGLGIEGDATSFGVASAGVEVTATWSSRGPGLIAQALGRKTVPGQTAGPTRGEIAATSTNAGAQNSGASAVYTGLGFDTCQAPSSRQMRAWSASPYRAVGIYIGGLNAACAQPNLTKAWLSHRIGSGWHPVPIFVGPQAPRNLCGCAPMSSRTKRAKSQGGAAAGAAVKQAQRLGISPGNPVYYDMEGYPTGGHNTPAVLAFLAGWTSELHAAGYLSGVYSSSSSGVADLVHKYGKGYPEPNDIWFANWNGRRSASDPYVPHKDWPHHQRLHQYAGGRSESYGGVTLDVDDDYVNGATATALDGYLILTTDGQVHRFGQALNYGSDANKLRRRVTAVSMAKDRKTGGYWILKSNGGVDNFHAPWDGSLKGKLKGRSPVAIAGSTRGGYLILTSDGGIHPFDSPWFGSKAGNLAPGVKGVGLAVDRRTGGYWLAKSNGGVNNFHAPFHGSLRHNLGGLAVTGLAPSRGGGYFVLTSDGGVHPFGPATFDGSDAGKLPTGVTGVALATSPTMPGYRILRSDGAVDAFGTRWFGGLLNRLKPGVRPAAIAAAA